MGRLPSQSQEMQNSLTAIQMWGEQGAFGVAFAKAQVLIEHEVIPVVALHWMELSRSFLKDARKYDFSPALREQNMLLSRFYWKLAHHVYWHQLKKGQIAPVQGFIQPANG